MRLIDSGITQLRPKDLPGPLTRVKKKKKQDLGVEKVQPLQHLPRDLPHNVHRNAPGSEAGSYLRLMLFGARGVMCSGSEEGSYLRRIDF